MLKLKKLKKHFVQFIKEASKYVLLFFVIMSFFDLYFYYKIWNSRMTNLFVELRFLVAVVVTIFEIVVLFCKLRTNIDFDIFKRKKQATEFEYEPDDFFIVPCYKGPPKRDVLRIEDYATHLQTIDDDVKTTVYEKLWKYLSKHRSPYLAAAEAMDSKMLSTLVKDLESTNLYVRVYAAEVIKFIAYTKENVKHIVEAGAIPSFIKFLKSDKSIDRYNAICVLGRICADGYGILCIQEGIIEPLIVAIDNSTDEETIKPFVYDNLIDDEDDAKKIAKLFIAVCRSVMDDETSLDSLVLLLPSLKKLPNLKNNDILVLVMSLIKDLMKTGPQLLIDYEVFKLLVECLPSVNHELQQTLYSCFMDFCVDNGENAEHLIDSGVLSTTKNVYIGCNLRVKNSILEFLSEVLVSKKSQYDAMVSAKLVPLLLISLYDKNEEIQEKAFDVLSNIVNYGCDIYTYEMLSEVYLPVIFNRLDDENLERIQFALLCLKNYLEKFWDFSKVICENILDENRIAKIQQLQMRPLTGKAANEVMATYVRLKDDF